VPIFLDYGFIVNVSAEQDLPDLFLGVDVAYENLAEIRKLIDEVSSYTNLFVIGCTGITYDYTKLNETCQYVYDKGLSFIIYCEIPPRIEWLTEAKERWKDRFLGLYVFDEVGGRQLDLRELWVTVLKADNYTDAGSQFIDGINWSLNRFKRNYTNSTTFPLFTSDYALYWFDYKAGYDVLLAQFGWNYSRQLNVALCRGAATVQNKDWGVMITWTYTAQPYIESGEELYEDLILAYENGAKYIVVFDSNKDYTSGILGEEHLEALKQFWQYAQDNPRENDPIGDRVAYVLPKDYGYGFRGPNDKIWGLWEADTLSNELCIALGNLIEKHGTKLDIIYDDGLELSNIYAYKELIFWNGTSEQDTVPPTISIVSPENKTYAVDSVSSTFVVSEPTVWNGYSLDGQGNVTITGNTTLTGLSDGSHSLTIYANDSAGNIGASGTIYFTIARHEPFPATWIAAAIAIIATSAIITLGVVVYRRKDLAHAKIPLR
jgi:hypothetical protein